MPHLKKYDLQRFKEALGLTANQLLAFPAEMKLALRRLPRNRYFAFIVMTTLALGIGVNTAIFSIAHSILIRPLPYSEPDRLVSLRHSAAGVDIPDIGNSDGTYLHYKNNSSVFESIALYQQAVVTLADESVPERVQITMVTPGLLTMLGARTLHGRVFREEDGQTQSPRRVVVGHSLWQRRFGQDPSIVGGSIEMNGRSVEVVGVLAEGFYFPDRKTQLYLARRLNPERMRLAAFWGFLRNVIGRLKPGVTREQAESDLQRLIPRLADAYPDASSENLRKTRLRAVVRPLKDAVVGDSRIALWTLLGMSALVFLIAFANATSLFIAHGERKRCEVAVRRALGATGGRLRGYFLAQSMWPACAGGALGLLTAAWGIRAFSRSGIDYIPRLQDVAVDGWPAALAAVLTIIAALSLAWVMERQSCRADMARDLRDGDRSGASAARLSMRNLIVGFQIALALILLVAATLLLRTFWQLQQVDPGFQAENVLTMEMPVPSSDYREYQDVVAFLNRVLNGIRALPGVQSAGAADALPLTPSVWEERLLGLDVKDRAFEAENRPLVAFRIITPEYLETLKVPLLDGRFPAEGKASAGMVVSQSLARRLDPEGRVFNQHIRRSRRVGWAPIVGIVADVRQESLRRVPTDTVYLPLLREAVDPEYLPSIVSLAVRSDLQPDSLIPPIRQVVHQINPKIPLSKIMTLEEIVSESTSYTRLTLRLLLMAGLAALFLSAVGVYGIVSYGVVHRRHEIGVRMALGAQTRQIKLMVLAQAFRSVLTGIGFGLVTSALLAPLLASLLFEVNPIDLRTFLGASALLLAAALLAAYLPARRATRVEPSRALTQG